MQHCHSFWFERVVNRRRPFAACPPACFTSVRMQFSTPGMPTDFNFNIPNEIILKVLDYLELRPSLIWASHVSQHWRALARSHPTFWKTISVGSIGTDNLKPSKCSLAVAQLQSSQNPEIEMRLEVGAKQPTRRDDLGSNNTTADEFISFELYSTLIQHISRISSLCLVVPHAVLTMLASRSLFMTLSPYLEQLELSASPHDQDSRRFIFQWSSITLMPRLRSLCLRHVEAALISAGKYALLLPHNGLQKEIIWRAPWPRAADQAPVLTELLERSPNLQTVHLVEVPQPLATAPEALMDRLAAMEILTFSDEFVQQIDVMRLS